MVRSGLIIGIISALAVKTVIPSATLAVMGFTMLWSVKELKVQTDRQIDRVRKGWCSENPKRRLFCDIHTRSQLKGVNYGQVR